MTFFVCINARDLPRDGAKQLLSEARRSTRTVDKPLLTVSTPTGMYYARFESWTQYDYFLTTLSERRVPYTKSTTGPTIIRKPPPPSSDDPLEAVVSLFAKLGKMFGGR